MIRIKQWQVKVVFKKENYFWKNLYSRPYALDFEVIHWLGVGKKVFKSNDGVIFRLDIKTLQILWSKMIVWCTA